MASMNKTCSSLGNKGVEGMVQEEVDTFSEHVFYTSNNLIFFRSNVVLLGRVWGQAYSVFLGHFHLCTIIQCFSRFFVFNPLCHRVTCVNL